MIAFCYPGQSTAKLAAKELDYLTAISQFDTMPIMKHLGQISTAQFAATAAAAGQAPALACCAS